MNAGRRVLDWAECVIHFLHNFSSVGGPIPIDSVHLELRRFRDSGQSAAHTSLEVSDPKEIIFNYTWQ